MLWYFFLKKLHTYIRIFFSWKKIKTSEQYIDMVKKKKKRISFHSNPLPQPTLKKAFGIFVFAKLGLGAKICKESWSYLRVLRGPKLRGAFTVPWVSPLLVPCDAPEFSFSPPVPSPPLSPMAEEYLSYVKTKPWALSPGGSVWLL